MYQVLLILSTQILGYSLAGLTRRYLVRPSGMIWPSTLVSTAMFTALHKDENKPADGWTISPRKFFARVFSGSVAFYFLPGLLFPALSYFSVVTWFAPKNVVVANLVSLPSLSVFAYANRSTVRNRIRSRIVSRNLRLGSDRLHWIPTRNALLGCAQYSRWTRVSHVDRSAINVYVILQHCMRTQC
jgi:hypothetical protein